MEYEPIWSDCSSVLTMLVMVNTIVGAQTAVRTKPTSRTTSLNHE